MDEWSLRLPGGNIWKSLLLHYKIYPPFKAQFVSPNSTQKQIQPLQVYSVFAFWIFHITASKNLEE